jgi:predicted N-acetyltransferase YhbS
MSLVAIDGGIVVGHAMLSRMRAPRRALGLGLVAIGSISYAPAFAG